MPSPKLIVRCAILAVAAALAAPIVTLAQTFNAGMGTNPVIPVGTPAEDTVKVTVPVHGRNADDLLYLRVRDGVYTVDGMVAKVKMNYDASGVKFLYLFVPGVGTAVVSAVASPDVPKTEAKLAENVLSFGTGAHTFRMTGIAVANGKGKAPEHLYVRLDSDAWQLGRQPMLGFGNVAEMPYQWPGALAADVKSASPQTEESRLVPPPVPVSLLPSRKTVLPVAAASSAAPKPVALTSTPTP